MDDKGDADNDEGADELDASLLFVLFTFCCPKRRGAAAAAAARYC